MKVYQLNDQHHNFGDCLNPALAEFLGHRPQIVDRHETGKLVAIGSVISVVKPGDTVFGSGIIKDRRYDLTGARVLAVRGKLTRERIDGAEVPEVYGDPALLLPLMYDPEVAQVHEIGVIPHYVDKYEREPINDAYEGALLIDIQAEWHSVVRMIKSCKLIVSSSLHGIIAAEAYGIPAVWRKYSENLVGGDFKFLDYLSGTGRNPDDFYLRGEWPAIPDLAGIQHRLLNAAASINLSKAV